MSFAIKQIASEGGEIRVLTAKESSKEAWFVVQLHPQSYSEFKIMSRSKKGNIADCGTILECGWGNLSQAEIDALKLKYTQS